MSVKKTKTMVVSRKEHRRSLLISVDEKILELVGSFKYLGQQITDNSGGLAHRSVGR